MYSPVGVEEPEAALHPAAAGLLLDSPVIQPEELLTVRAVDGNTEIAPPVLDSRVSAG
jgi:hypothetical protein